MMDDSRLVDALLIVGTINQLCQEAVREFATVRISAEHTCAVETGMRAFRPRGRRVHL